MFDVICCIPKGFHFILEEFAFISTTGFSKTGPDFTFLPVDMLYMCYLGRNCRKAPQKSEKPTTFTEPLS